MRHFVLLKENTKRRWSEVEGYWFMNVIVWHERCSRSNNWEGIFVSCGMCLLTSKDDQNEGLFVSFAKLLGQKKCCFTFKSLSEKPFRKRKRCCVELPLSPLEGEKHRLRFPKLLSFQSPSNSLSLRRSFLVFSQKESKSTSQPNNPGFIHSPWFLSGQVPLIPPKRSRNPSFA